MTLALFLVLAQADFPREVAGTWADPARTVFLDPGARSLLSGFSPASIDGLQPSASMIRFDGVLVRLPAHGFFGPSTLPAQWLEGVHLGAAAESVETGRSLGRSITLLPRRGAPTGWHGSVRQDLLATSLTVDGVIESTRTELQAGARFFTLPALAASALKVRALLGDWQLRAVQPVADGHLRVLALGVADDAALTVSGIPLSARVFSQLADVRWTQGPLELGLLGSHDSIALAIRAAQTRHDIIGGEQAVRARAAFRPMITREVQLAMGAELSLRRVVLQRASDSLLPPIPGVDPAAITSTVRRDLGPAVNGGLFLEARDDRGPFRWAAGVRGDVWKPFDAAPMGSFDPRISIERDFGPEWTVFGSAGVRHQTATWLVPVPVLDTTSWNLGLQQAFVGDLGARFRPSSSQLFVARLFGSSLRRTIELSPFDDTFLPEVNGATADVQRRIGSGWAGGGSLSWDFKPNATSWVRISYGLVVSRRSLTITRWGIDGLPRREERVEVPSSFEQNHQLLASGGLKLGAGWSLGASITFQSGAPMDGSLYSVDQQPGADPIRRSVRWVPIDRDVAGRADPWVRVDARVSKTWQPAPFELELFLDVQNLSVWAQPTGRSFGVAPATLEEQARGDISLTSKPASSPLGFPIPVLGLEARL